MLTVGLKYTDHGTCDSRAKQNERLCQKVVFIWAIRSAGSSTNPDAFLCTAGLTITLLEYIRWIEDILMPALAGVPSSIEVVVKIHVTKPEKDSEKLGNYESKTKESLDEELDPTDNSHSRPIARAVDSPYVSFENGRPDLHGIIQQEIAMVSGRMSISGKPEPKFVRWDSLLTVFFPACGPFELGNAVRKAIRTPRFMDILRGGPTVTLHVEKFGSVSIYIWNEELEINCFLLVVNTATEKAENRFFFTLE